MVLDDGDNGSFYRYDDDIPPKKGSCVRMNVFQSKK